MIDILAFAFLVFGLLGVLKEWHIDARVYGDDLAYDRLSSGIPSYHDDEHIRQCRGREREKARRAAESGSVCVQYPPLHSHLPHGIL